MRRKFRIDKDEKNEALTILESGEVGPGEYLALHEETYSLSEIKEALESGGQAFKEKVRRRNFFPTSDLCGKLYQQMTPFLSDESENKLVMDYDDAEALPIEEEEELEEEEEGVELDELLGGDSSDLAEDDIEEIDGDDDTPQFQPDDNSEHEE